MTSERTKTIAISTSAAVFAAAVATFAAAYFTRQKNAPAPLAGAPPVANAPMFDAPAFALTDQDGRPFTSAQLRGKVWLAAFIFTRCGGPCPLMTEKMRDAQKAIGNANVGIVSFSLEPAYDTPPVLKQYAKDHCVDETNWRLLTGDAKVIYAVAKGFKMGAIPASGEQGIEHDTHFVLVDRNGNVRDYFSGADDEGWKRAAAEAVRISAE